MVDDNAEAPGGAAFLARALQFGDTMFPVGGFSFSCGLESAIQKRVVTDATTLHAFARTAIDQAARGDGIALVVAHRAARMNDLDALVKIDRQVYARKLSEEMRTMTVRMGKKFTELSAQLIDAPLLRTWREHIDTSATPGCYPTGLAITFALQGLPALSAFTVHQYGVASAILGAALRLMKIGHIETQGILYELSGHTATAFEAAAVADLSDMAGYAPMTEILNAIHAKAHVRLFMS